MRARTGSTRNLRNMRTSAGLTQSELARIAKVSKSMISLVESGEREPSERWMWAVKEAIAKHAAGTADESGAA